MSDLERNLHLTLGPAFNIPRRKLPELELALRAFASQTPTITAKVKTRRIIPDENGPDLQISQLESHHIAEAHHALWRGIKQLGGISERPLFIEDNYLAHITHPTASDGDLEEGSEVKVSSVRLSRFNKETKTEHYSSEIFNFV